MQNQAAKCDVVHTHLIRPQSAWFAMRPQSQARSVKGGEPMQPAIFLDRDGVINDNRADHVTTWADFVPVHGALAGVRALSRLGLPIFVVTNQAIVGRGIITAEALDALHSRMCRLFSVH